MTSKPDRLLNHVSKIGLRVTQGVARVGQFLGPDTSNLKKVGQTPL